MSNIEIRLAITEEGASSERLDNLTTQLMNDLKQLKIKSAKRLSDKSIEKGAKGDPLTLGALILVMAPAILSPLVEFLKSWTIERRRIVIEAPNGAKLEFVPDKKYSEAELLAFVDKINQIPASGATSAEPAGKQT